MIRRISVCVYDRNTAIDDDADAAMVGLGVGDWAVAAMTSSTLRLKNAAKPSAVWTEAPVTLRSRPTIEDSDRYTTSATNDRVQQCGPSSTASCLCRRADGGEPRRPTGAGQRRNVCVDSVVQDAGILDVHVALCSQHQTTAQCDLGVGV